MFNSEFSDIIRISIPNTKQSIELDQRRVKIRENQKGLMAVSYVAPVFEAMDIENFFEEVLTSEELKMNIGDTGDFTVRFRGIVEGKNKNFPQNLDHKIILLQGPVSLDPRMNVQLTGFSKFKIRGKISQ